MSWTYLSNSFSSLLHLVGAPLNCILPIPNRIQIYLNLYYYVWQVNYLICYHLTIRILITKNEFTFFFLSKLLLVLIVLYWWLINNELIHDEREWWIIILDWLVSVKSFFIWYLLRIILFLKWRDPTWWFISISESWFIKIVNIFALG